MMHLFDSAAQECSEAITKKYSTSFASAIRLLHKDLRAPIHGIYGFVRLADEIVDTFHDFDKETLLADFRRDTYAAIAQGISLNPVLHSFQRVVRAYSIPQHLIDAFLYSMELDLEKKVYCNTAELDEYIYGSAEVVGLMCLYVFVEGNEAMYQNLKESARKLGAAFQKVNFLRDLQADYQDLQRTYFPDFDKGHFDAESKERIEADIEQDFHEAICGIRQLPWKARFGVYTAFRYYRTLFQKIRQMKPQKVLQQRVRVADYRKLWIVMQARMEYKLNLI